MTNSGAEADALFKDATEKYAAALKINPDLHEALNNWGVALAARARTKSGAEADALFKDASENYAAALKIKPDRSRGAEQFGCITALADETGEAERCWPARMNSGAEADALFKGAGRVKGNCRRPARSKSRVGPNKLHEAELKSPNLGRSASGMRLAGADEIRRRGRRARSSASAVKIRRRASRSSPTIPKR